jgi:hypothetical protein
MRASRRAGAWPTRRVILPLAAALAFVLAVPGPSLRAPAPAQASANQLALFGESTGLLADPRGTLRTLRSLGVGVVRVTLRWRTLVPQPWSSKRPRTFDAADPGAYPLDRFRRYDEIVRAAQSDGITIEFLLGGGAPGWAVGGRTLGGGGVPQWNPSARDYGRFVQAVATRYSGSYRPSGSASPLPTVHFWELWNEPNFGQALAPQAIRGSSVSTSPRLYRALLDAGWSALQRTGHGNDTVVVGNLSPRGFNSPSTRRYPEGLPGKFSTTKPLQFVRTLYCVDRRLRRLHGHAAALVGCPTTAAGSRRFPGAHPGLFDATGFGIHPYPFNLPPTRVDSKDPDFVEFAEIPRLASTLDRIQRGYGSARRMPIYNTEFGYITSPPNNTAHYGSHFLPPKTAARYMNWAEYLSWRNPRVATTMQYLLYDPSPKASGFATGLIFHDGRAKPMYAAYRMPVYLPVARSRRGHAVEVWGCVRPSHYASIDTGGAAQHVQIQFRPGSRGRFTTIATVPISNAHGYFDVHVAFPASGSMRLAWRYPSGRSIYSRTVTVTVH